MSAGAAPAAAPRRGERFARTAAAEWVKLRSLSSTWWCAGVAIAGMAIFAVFLGNATASGIAEDPAGAQDVSFVPLTSQGVFYLVQFAVLALAALAGAGEYAHGGMRTTLRWVPHRGVVLAARTAVVAALAGLVGAASAAVGVAVFAAVLGSAARVDLGDAAAVVAGVAAGMALLAVLFTGLATALRSVAGTITLGFLLLMGIPMAMILTGVQSLNDLAAVFPGLAAIEFYASGDAGFYTAPHDGAANIASLAGWAAAAQIAAYAELRARDA